MKNPHRHCQCVDRFIDVVTTRMAQEGVPQQLLHSWKALCAQPIAGCAGTELPQPHWHHIKDAVRKVMERDGEKILRSIEEEADLEEGSLDISFDAAGFYEKLAVRVTASFEKLWSVLLHGGKPGQTINFSETH